MTKKQNQEEVERINASLLRLCGHAEELGLAERLNSETSIQADRLCELLSELLGDDWGE